MEAVKAFNLELSGLYEVRPPISKAKMTLITKGAIKAIKLYKHVVQSVEKFIQKCKPEYKVPGLYVVDSIVRQSRHQFGADRDVFAPRFAKNMQQTFINLFACPEEEKSKVIRVLNLWQKNHVFPPEVIQPLFDLADPNHPVYNQNSIQSNGLGNQKEAPLIKSSPAIQKSPATTKGSSQVSHAADPHSGAVNTNNLPDTNTFTPLQQLNKTVQKQGGDGIGKVDSSHAVRFDRKLLDFDYDDDEEDDLHQHINPSPKLPPHNPPASSAMDTVGSLLSNPEVLRQLQTLQQSMSQPQYPDIDLERIRRLQEMKQQEDEFDKHLIQTVPNLPFAAECDLKHLMNPPPPSMQPYYMTGIQDLAIPPPGYKQSHPVFEPPVEVRNIEPEVLPRGPSREVPEVEVINLDQGDSRSPTPIEDRYANRRIKTRSRERSRDRGRGKDRDRRSKRSRSRTHSRERRRPRTRSRERDRNRDREREREKEKEREREKEKDREKEKERRKRGVPPLKKEHLCVCSTTLWVGHLSKLVHQEELSDAFGEYGAVNSIDLIPPRGCAFIVMHRRQDAARCLEKLKNHKLQGKAITIAWAPGKGLKGKELKDYWEVDLGVSYIPWSKLKPDIDIDLLEDGGMIDEDSMPDWLKTKLSQTLSTIMSSPQIPLIPNIPVLSRPSLPPSLANLDTSQPPPIPGAMLQPPPTLPLQMVNPFQLNLSMNLPPNMMPTVPIGVPPPNMPPPSMMANQLLFAQPPTPNLLPPPMSLPTPTKPPLLQKPIAPFSLMQMPPPFHDDNMDVEMEDVDKLNKPPPLSDQLLASLGHNTEESNLSAAVSRLNAVSGSKNDEKDTENYRDRKGTDNDRDKRDERSRYSSDRNDSRDHREDRDYRQNRDDRDGRDRRDRRDRRERSNRWADKDTDERREFSDTSHQDPYLSNRDGNVVLNKEAVVTFEPPPDRTTSLADDVFSSRFSGDQIADINAFINPEPPSDAFLHQSRDATQVQNFKDNEWQSNPQDKWVNNNEEENLVEHFGGDNHWQPNQRDQWNNANSNNNNNNNEDNRPTQNFNAVEWQPNQTGQWDNKNGNEQAPNFESNSNWQSNQRNEWSNNEAVDRGWEPPNLMDNNPEQNNFNMPPNVNFERNNGPPQHTDPPRGNFDFNRDNSHHTPFLTVRNEMFLKDERFLQNNNFPTDGNAYQMGNSNFGPIKDSLLGPGPSDSMFGGEAMHGGFDQQQSIQGGFDQQQSMHGRYDQQEPVQAGFENQESMHGGFNQQEPIHGGFEQQESVHEGFDQQEPMYDETENQDLAFAEPPQYHPPPHFSGLDRGRSEYGGGPDRGQQHRFGGPGFGGPGFRGPGFGSPRFNGPGFGNQDHGGFVGRGFRGRDNRRGFRGPERGRRGFGGPRPDFRPRTMRDGDGFRPRGRGGAFYSRGQQGRGARQPGQRWNEGGDRNFQNRFDSQPDHFKGPKFNEHPRRGGYDDSRPGYNRRDKDERRPYRRDFEERQPRQRRSRWGSSPRAEESYYDEGNAENPPNEEFSSEPYAPEEVQEGCDDNSFAGGNSTPLHDEPQEPEVAAHIPETTVESENSAVPAVDEQQ